VTRALLPVALGLLLVVAGCESPQRYTTTMEVVQIEPLTDGTDATTRVGLELRYADCPGDNRRVLRADKAAAACVAKHKPGDKLKAEIVTSYQSDRGVYRADLTRLGDCTLKQDPKDDANYEMVQTCSDIVATGAVVGVRCDRTRSKELVVKCPWLRRR